MSTTRRVAAYAAVQEWPIPADYRRQLDGGFRRYSGLVMLIWSFVEIDPKPSLRPR
jgi:hypothetical protein